MDLQVQLCPSQFDCKSSCPGWVAYDQYQHQTPSHFTFLPRGILGKNRNRSAILRVLQHGKYVEGWISFKAFCENSRQKDPHFCTTEV